MSTQLSFDAYPMASNVQQLRIMEHRPLPAIVKEFQDTIKSLSYSRHTWQVWEDFCEMAAISLSNAIAFSEEREKTYRRLKGLNKKAKEA